MIKPLQRMTYFSRSLIRGPDWFVETEIERLLATARERNKTLQVTGMLLFSDGCFAQILEGEADDLDMLFPSIQADHRHAEVTVLQRGLIGNRAFAGWEMNFVSQKLGTSKSDAPSLFHRLASVVQGRA